MLFQLLYNNRRNKALLAAIAQEFGYRFHVTLIHPLFIKVIKIIYTNYKVNYNYAEVW